MEGCVAQFTFNSIISEMERRVAGARWARKKVAEENTSVSKLVVRMLEDQMRRNDDYWKAYEKWKKIKPIPGLDTAQRMSSKAERK
jgi:hypothetical protein